MNAFERHGTLPAPATRCRRPPIPPRLPLRPRPQDGPQIAWALLVFTLLAVAHTWPLASNPAHLSRNDTGDYLLNEWIVSWVARQLVRDPSRLFEANIFYPEHNVLAFSEPLIVPGLMAVPMRGLGASPVLTYNLLLLIGFTLTALAMYVFVASITGNHLSGLLAGSILAFNTHTLTRIAHLQIIHAEWLPLAIWMFDRVLTGARTRDALWLALFVVLLTFTSGYLAMFVVLALVAGFLARPEDWWGARAKPVVGRLALAGALSLIVALPGNVAVSRRSREQQGLVRSLPAITAYSATPWAYLTTTSRLHYDAWSQTLYKRAGHDKFFTGFVALGLALVAVWGRRTLRDNRRTRMLLAMALAGVRPVARRQHAHLPARLPRCAADAGSSSRRTLRLPRDLRGRGIGRDGVGPASPAYPEATALAGSGIRRHRGGQSGSAPCALRIPTLPGGIAGVRCAGARTGSSGRGGIPFLPNDPRIQKRRLRVQLSLALASAG